MTFGFGEGVLCSPAPVAELAASVQLHQPELSTVPVSAKLLIDLEIVKIFLFCCPRARLAVLPADVVHHRLYVARHFESLFRYNT